LSVALFGRQKALDNVNQSIGPNGLFKETHVALLYTTKAASIAENCGELAVSALGNVTTDNLLAINGGQL